MLPCGSISDYWAEAEKLVDEGLVRTLGVCNMSLAHIETILTFCRHRPVMASFEMSILNHCEEVRSTQI